MHDFSRIVRTEWLKISGYPAFWWVLGITALTYPGINYMFLNVYQTIIEKQSQTGKIVQMLIGNPFSFPEAWRTVAFFSSLFIFIPAILVIMLITNEYTYKTHRQNIIDGWTRKAFLAGKLVDVFLLSLLVTAIYAGVALFIGRANTSDPTASARSLSHYIGLFGLQAFSQLSIAFLIGLIVRKSFIALAVFAFYGIILEPIAAKFIEFKLHAGWWEYLPLEISKLLLPKPAFLGKLDEAAWKAALANVQPHVWLTIGLSLLTWLLCYVIFQKRDL
jgi:ABC-2 type transport system permease protein